jgi:16S rRNA (guanine(1405)-N(7))-methyltransferase
LTRDDIANDILKSRKYAGLDRALVERVCAEVMPKYPRAKDVVKAVRKELHIIHESFLPEDSHAKADALIAACEGGDIASDTELARRLMALHASTRERLPRAEEIYGFVSGHVSAEDHVLDIGCGFGPFALPFYRARPKMYAAYDIGGPNIRTLNAYFARAGLAYRAEILDAAVHTPAVRGDMCLLFKLLPLLEHQKKGRGFELLCGIDCKVSIVSFPLKSASGKEKGMEAFYSAYFEGGLPSGMTITDKAVFGNEMFYVVETM